MVYFDMLKKCHVEFDSEFYYRHTLKFFQCNKFRRVFFYFLLITLNLLALQQHAFAENLSRKSNLESINEKLKIRAESDKIPIYSYNQSAIGNCPPYEVPDLNDIPDKVPEQEVPVVKKESLNPVSKPSLPEKKQEFKTTVTKKNITENDYKSVEPSVSSLKINNKLSYDFEVITWPNGIVSVPIKTFAELLDVPVFVNHVDNSLSFTQPGTNNQVNIDVKNSKVMLGSQQIDVRNPKIIYRKEGFLINDDVYIPEQLAQYLLDVKTNFLTEKFTMNVETSRILKAIVEMDSESDTPNKVYEEQFTNVNSAEKENKVFKVKRIDYSLGSTMNKSNSSDLSTSEQNTNLSIGSSGNFLGGHYTLGTNSFYNKDGLGIGGYTASLDYIGTQHELSLGSNEIRLSDLAIPGANIVGAKFGTLGASNNSSAVPRIISGRADDNTYVELFVNDIYTDKQTIENGRFDFDSLNYPSGSFIKIRVEQVNQDNTRKTVYEHEFSQDKDLLAPGQNEYLAFSGIDNSITNQNIKLFSKKTQDSSYLPIKYMSGFKFKRGLTKKLTVGSNFANNFNLTEPTKFFAQNTTDSVRTFRQSELTTGSVATVSANYAPIANLMISTETGFSSASSKSKYETNGNDFGSVVSFDYDPKQYKLTGKVFNYGSNFYSGGYSDTTDKRGIELGGNWNVDKVNISGNILKYNSNLDNLFNGGLSDISSYNLSASGPINDKSTLRMGIRSASAKNSLVYNGQTDLSLTLNSNLSEKVNFMVDFIKSKNRNEQNDNQSKSGTSTNRLNANLDIDAGKVGVFRLSHEIMTLTPEERMYLSSESSDYTKLPISKSVYVKLDRSNKPFKHFTASPNFGYRYNGDNKGVLFGLGLGYELRAGRQLMMNYSYNSLFARYNNSNFISGNSSHTLSLNLVDSLNFGETAGLSSALDRDSFNPENGIIKGCVFLDLNQNGVKDAGEEGVAGIDVTVKNMYTVTTDKKGNYVAPRLFQAIHAIGVDKDNLAFIYSPVGNDVAVNVKRGRVYVANLGVIVIPGSVSGKVDVKIPDKSCSDVIILLLDKDNKEVKYTTTDSSGSYYIGAIPPGEYKVIVDKNYLDYNGLQVGGKQQEYAVSIPLIIDDFVEINDINFKLIEKQAEVKSF